MEIIFQRLLHPTVIRVRELYPGHAKSLLIPNISNLNEAFLGGPESPANLLLGKTRPLVQRKDPKEL